MFTLCDLSEIKVWFVLYCNNVKQESFQCKYSKTYILFVAVHTSVFACLLPSVVSKQRQWCMSVKYNRDPFQLRWLKSTMVHVTDRFVIVVPILREMKLDFLRKDDWLNWVKMVYFCFRVLYFIYIFISNHFYFNMLTHSDKLIK